MSSSSGETSSCGSSEDAQLIRMDIERGKQLGQRGWITFVWRNPLPLVMRRKLFGLVKIIACLVTVLFVVQSVYLARLRHGLVRVANDPFDLWFPRNIHWDSPSIWNSKRQSFMHNALPVPVHSHNDYWRRIPLFEAIGSGCISAEADIHLRDSDLFVGHTASSLRPGLTLRSMYLEPLQRMLETQNANVTNGTWRGLFNLDPQQTFVLLVDHKTSGPETFTELYAQLQPLRDLDYLTYWNGTERVMRPLTVVASGSAPFESVTALNATHRDIFWDAKLDRLMSINDDYMVEPPIYAYNRSNSYFASTQFKNAMLYPEKASQLEQASVRGLLSRYWDTPSEPPNLQEVVWRVLVESKVDILNMDDLGVVRDRAHAWGRIQT